MAPIGLDEMKSVRLMSRIDTKFVTDESRLLSILRCAAEQHYSVQVSPEPLNVYDSTYYDTPELDMFTMHHARMLPRQKIRSRTYVESDLSFLEIKNKNNKSRTAKKRIKVSDTSRIVLPRNLVARDFVATHSDYTFAHLKPMLETMFTRITLVNPQKTERITIDVGVHFKNFNTGATADLDGLVIIELKQDGRYRSTMRDILRAHQVQPFHVSKYCMGVTLTDHEVYAGRFKRKLHLLNKIRNK